MLRAEPKVKIIRVPNGPLLPLHHAAAP